MRKVVFAAIAALALSIAAFASVAYADDFRIPIPDRSANELYVDTVTRNSKKVVVGSFYTYMDGDVLKVKIGKKTYTKKLKYGMWSATVRIKKPKTWKKLCVTLYDANGNVVGKPYKDRVYYSDGVEIGMTKKQVRQAYGYGKPDFTMTLKGGYPAWFYWDDEGSTYCVVFKNGKVASFD